MKIIPLGTNGFFPSFGRQTASYAIPLGKLLIILDAGSGLFRLAEPEGKKLLEGVSEVHLFLSHYHLDHTFGFYAAFRLLERKTVKVYAASVKKVFSEFKPMGYFPIDYKKEMKNFQWYSIKESTQHINSYRVDVRKQYHNGEGSLAFRFYFSPQLELAYITDSDQITPESIKFVKGSSILLHEHFMSGRGDYPKNKDDTSTFAWGHVTSIGAAEVAKEAKVGNLALIHHFPYADNNQLEQQLKIAQSIFPNTNLAKDLEDIQF